MRLESIDRVESSARTMVAKKTMPARESLHVGNGAGFWGDNLDAPFLLARDGKLDVLDARVPRRADDGDPEPSSFPGQERRLCDGFPRAARAPGSDPGRTTSGCGSSPMPAVSIHRRARARCGEILEAAAMPEMPIGMVAGDDVLDRVPHWIEQGIDLSHLETGEPISTVADRLVAANVYFGARPIAEALGRRCAHRPDRASR